MTSDEMRIRRRCPVSRMLHRGMRKLHFIAEQHQLSFASFVLRHSSSIITMLDPIRTQSNLCLPGARSRSRNDAREPSNV